MIAAKRFSTYVDFSPNLYNGVQQMYTSVSGRQDSALSHRGRQRGRLPRARGGQDRQGVAHLELMGAEGEQRYNISNPRRCTCVQSAHVVNIIPLLC